MHELVFGLLYALGARAFGPSFFPLSTVFAAVAAVVANLEKILNNPVLRWLEPLISLFVKPAIRRRDTVPPWLRR